MRVQEHLKISAAAAFITLPWLKGSCWLPFTASILIDVDHYLWHMVSKRTLSLRAAIRYFGQADPPQLVEARLLHHPLVLGSLLYLAWRFQSRLLWLILSGLLFHVSLDVIHGNRMSNLKRRLSVEAAFCCSDCGLKLAALQLHTICIPANILDRYNPRHFKVLCPACHELAHAD